MATYQDIVDYMNKNYVGDHSIIKHDGYYTMNTNDDDCSISINEDSFLGVLLIALIMSRIS